VDFRDSLVSDAPIEPWNRSDWVMARNAAQARRSEWPDGSGDRFQEARAAVLGLLSPFAGLSTRHWRVVEDRVRFGEETLR